jgi:hypothetical protein
MLSVNLSGRMTGYTEVMLDHNSVVAGAAVPAGFKRLIRRHNFLLSPDNALTGLLTVLPPDMMSGND